MQNMSVTEKQLDEACAKYGLEKKELQIQGMAFHLLVAEDLEKLFDRLLQKPINHPDVREERVPYWAELWPSSVAIAQHILNHPTRFAQQQAVELGCGLGLAGIAAGKVGAKVALTDYMEDALEVAALNWRRNMAGESVSVHLLDWRYPPKGQYDWIIAADVAYEQHVFEPLLKTFDALLKPEGKILFAEPRRWMARPFRQELLKKYRALESLSSKHPFRGTTAEIDVFVLERV